MVRAIDASRFGEIMEQWKKDCLECDDQYGADVISDVILQLDDMPTLTPPNEPLTLEQLREMDGEPVWIAPAKSAGKIPSRWTLYSGVSKSLDCTDVYVFATASGIAQGYKANGYGNTWLACRRSPEGADA